MRQRDKQLDQMSGQIDRFSINCFFTGFVINPSETAADYPPDRRRDEGSIWTECRYNKHNADGDNVPPWKAAVHVQKIRLY